MNNNFTRAHNSYLEPPEDDPICEDGCGETMTRDITGEWVCMNKFCPSKFQGVEREMAEMLIGANETVKSLYKKLQRLQRIPTPKEVDEAYRNGIQSGVLTKQGKLKPFEFNENSMVESTEFWTCSKCSHPNHNIAIKCWFCDSSKPGL